MSFRRRLLFSAILILAVVRSSSNINHDAVSLSKVTLYVNIPYRTIFERTVHINIGFYGYEEQVTRV